MHRCLVEQGNRMCVLIATREPSTTVLTYNDYSCTYLSFDMYPYTYEWFTAIVAVCVPQHEHTQRAPHVAFLNVRPKRSSYSAVYAALYELIFSWPNSLASQVVAHVRRAVAGGQPTGFRSTSCTQPAHSRGDTTYGADTPGRKRE